VHLERSLTDEQRERAEREARVRECEALLQEMKRAAEADREGSSSR